MNLKDVKEKVADTFETENPPGTDYYGTELDESKVEKARERMDANTEKATPKENI